MAQISDEEARRVLTTTSGWIPVTALDEGGGARVYRVMPTSVVLRFQSLVTPISNAREHTWSRGMELAAAISEVADGTLSVLAAGKVSKERTHRMDREIGILRDVQHPNLIKMLGHDETSNPIWYVMELMRGGTLKGAGARFRGDVPLVLRGMEQVAQALGALHAHDSIVHRDVKPANIFLRENGDWVLGDPGVAYRTDGGDETTTRPVSKDWFPRWYDDELGHKPLCDLYMLGAVSIFLLTGEKPLAPNYLRKPKLKLTALFPEAPAIAEVYRLLCSLIVDEPEEIPFKNGDELAAAVRELIPTASDDATHRLRLAVARLDSEPKNLFSYSNEGNNGGDVPGLTSIPLWVPSNHDHLAVWIESEHPYFVRFWNPVAPVDRLDSSTLSNGTGNAVPVPEKLRGRWIRLSVMRSGSPGNGAVRSLSIYATRDAGERAV